MIYHKHDMKDNSIKDLEGMVRRAKPKVQMDDAMTARLLGDLYAAGATKRSSYRWRWWCGGAAACAALLLGLWWGFHVEEDAPAGRIVPIVSMQQVEELPFEVFLSADDMAVQRLKHGAAAGGSVRGGQYKLIIYNKSL